MKLAAAYVIGICEIVFSTPIGHAGLLSALLLYHLCGCAALSPKVGPVGPGGDGGAAAAAGIVAYQSAFGVGASLVCLVALLTTALAVLALRRAALAAIDALYRSCPPDNEEADDA